VNALTENADGSFTLKAGFSHQQGAAEAKVHPKARRFEGISFVFNRGESPILVTIRHDSKLPLIERDVERARNNFITPDVGPYPDDSRSNEAIARTDATIEVLFEKRDPR